MEIYGILTYIDELKQEKKAQSNVKDGYIKVESSYIKAIKYSNSLLVVKFVSGETYVYADIAPETILEMLSAASVGKYFASRIRDKYDFIRI